MTDFNFSSFLNEPTRIAKSSATLIDVVFSNVDGLVKETKTYACPFSDHNFVVIALSTDRIRNSAVTFKSRFITQKKIGTSQ